eukprot:284129-Pelagomonas_calceolata.AAC.1
MKAPGQPRRREWKMRTSRALRSRPNELVGCVKEMAVCLWSRILPARPCCPMPSTSLSSASSATR